MNFANFLGIFVMAWGLSMISPGLTVFVLGALIFAMWGKAPSDWSKEN